MSGFEVVGVVLGAIPLIISAIDSYKATSQRIKFMVKKELLLNQLIQSLEEQKFYFQTDICLALKEAHLEEKQIIAQIDERGLNLFQGPEISDALKEYLGEGFTLYINAVARCEYILSDIIANISGLVATPQWDRNDPRQFSSLNQNEMVDSNLLSESNSVSEKKIYSDKSTT